MDKFVAVSSKGGDEEGGALYCLFSNERPKLLASHMLLLPVAAAPMHVSLLSFAFSDGTAGGRSEFAVRN